MPASAENEYSTYGHLVDCYLEILDDRELLGAERTAIVIHNKPWYTWIYTTVLRDEKQIAGVVDRHQHGQDEVWRHLHKPAVAVRHTSTVYEIVLGLRVGWDLEHTVGATIRDWVSR